MQWIAEHRDIITTLTSTGTLFVWVIYLQVFVSSYRRQLRAVLLITRGPGEGLDARCFLSNMSSGSIYVESVLVRLHTQARTTVMPVTDSRGSEDGAPDDGASEEVGRWTRQGPLGSGEARDIGSFGGLIREAGWGTPDAGRGREASVQSITVEVIGIYGSEDLPVGARRTFLLHDRHGRWRIEGKTLRTRQVTTRRERRKLIADLEHDR